MYQLEGRINNQILGVKGSRRKVLSIASLPGGTRKFSHKLLRNVYSTSTSSRTATETHCFMLSQCSAKHLYKPGKFESRRRFFSLCLLAFPQTNLTGHFRRCPHTSEDIFQSFSVLSSLTNSSWQKLFAPTFLLFCRTENATFSVRFRIGESQYSFHYTIVFLRGKCR